jgi:hypothetical protein
MEVKQTAVEWFQDQIIKIVNGTCQLSEIQIFEQALEMEKEQHKKSWVNGMFCDHGDEIEEFEQYYNETFKSK